MQDLTLSLAEPTTLALVAATGFIAGFVRGFSGFGGPAIMLLVLTQLYAPASVIPKILVMDMVASLKLQREAFTEVQWRETIALSVATLITIPAGLFALTHFEPDIARRGVAVMAGLATIAMLAGLRFKRPQPIIVWFGFGLLVGVVVGWTGIALLGMVFLFSMPSAASVSRANALSWLFLVTPLGLVAHFVAGTLDFDALWRSVVMGMVYVLGATLGARWFRATAEILFRRIVAGVLLCLAAIAIAS